MAKNNLLTNITGNLRFPPRAYQIAALEYWLGYMDNSPEFPVQLLFNMATGSGKTYVMAALMLDLYRRGWRNFIFFVNSANILEKTRDNFINLGSPKYLFASNIKIDGKFVRIREVQNFYESDPMAINIIFTTTQRLHLDLNRPHENRISYAELAQNNIVLIGDEAHHNNAQTNSTRANTSGNWEETVAEIQRQNPQTFLLEFTATMDFDDATIRKKYHNRNLFQYDLRRFRQDGFSKDVLVYGAADNLQQRELQAIIIGQYRKYVAEKHGISLKPVVMFKSRTVYENKTNLTNFELLIRDLGPQQLAAISAEATGILQKAFGFFTDNSICMEQLCQDLQQDFCPKNLLRMDGGQQISRQLQYEVNTLELPENNYRAIFAVDMLKEGWDVLNLFDIVRLYETRDGKTKNGIYTPGKTTISEAQLIGRGARYFPFAIDGKNKYQRKFDDDPENELRVLEQLHYHTSHDVKYIREIRQALDEIGITNFGANPGADADD